MGGFGEGGGELGGRGRCSAVGIGPGFYICKKVILKGKLCGRKKKCKGHGSQREGGGSFLKLGFLYGQANPDRGLHSARAMHNRQRPRQGSQGATRLEGKEDPAPLAGEWGKRKPRGPPS